MNESTRASESLRQGRNVRYRSKVEFSFANSAIAEVSSTPRSFVRRSISIVDECSRVVFPLDPDRRHEDVRND